MTRKRTKNHHPVPERQKLDADWLSPPSPSCPTTLRSVTFGNAKMHPGKSHFTPQKSAIFATIDTFPQFSTLFTENFRTLFKIRKSSPAPVKRSTNQKRPSIFRSRQHAHTVAVQFRHTNTNRVRSENLEPCCAAASVCVVCVQFYTRRKTIYIAPIGQFSRKNPLSVQCLQFSAPISQALRHFSALK